VPLSDSRQFSGLVTLATRPLLRCENLERRRGFEPRTPRLQLRPLATCCCGAWHPGGDSNTQWRVWNPPASPSALGQNVGAPGWIRTSTITAFEAVPLPDWSYGRIDRNGRTQIGRLRIRTDTGHGLSVLPLPVGLRACGVRGEIRTRNNAALNRTRLPELRHPNIGGQSRIRTLDVSQRDTGATARRFRPLSQLPKHELSKIWRKAGDSNAYVPEDPGLADQWDTNYPSLPGKSKM
jgi:hypothetical protein